MAPPEPVMKTPTHPVEDAFEELRFVTNTPRGPDDPRHDREWRTVDRVYQRLGQLMTKAALLDKAKEAVGDRGLNYGKPEDNFERIAARWRTHLRNRFKMDLPIDGTSVAIMMADMKLARLENEPNHADSWVDLAGYAACGAEIAVKGKVS